MRLLKLTEVAERLGLSPVSLQNGAYRQRIGLPITRIGNAVRVAEIDLARFIERHRETTQVEGRD
jgi:hypothetical protein